ncbi:ABC transporter substrate-binding protein [Brevibacillus sp. TJ4]|uniref:ABC transporter substrate-binding protein n=1 Tax=Brevibacillus sp. TJ4 TaxID=3234853 RepID=UPI0037D4EBA0
MQKSLKLALGSFLALSLALAGCGQSGGNATPPQTEQGQEGAAADPIALDIGMLKLTSSAPLFIGIEKGFFAEEGIEANATWFDAAQPIAVATASGSVDVGATGITASLYNMVAGGQKLVIVADKGREQAGYSSSALLFPSDSPLNSIEDLKGKKVGITQTGSTYHYMAGRLLENHGLTLQDIELIPLNNIKGLMEALKSKQVDAVLLNEPNISTVVEEGYGKVVAQIGDEMDYQTSGIFFSPALAENKDAAQRFLRAYIKSSRYYYDAVLNKENGEVVPGENYEEVVNIIAQYTDQEPDMIKKGMPYMDRDGKLLESDIKTQVEWYAKEKLIDQVIDTTEIVNTQLLEDALQSLGK